MKTALVAVDITNQYYSVQSSHHTGARIDYEKYLTAAVSQYNLYRAFAYGAQMSDEAYGFITVLKSIGFEPKYRRAVSVGDRPDIRRTDRNLILAMDVWRTIERVDVVILGSNDSELVPLVQRIKELGIQVIIYSCNIGRELREAADRCIEIDPEIMERRKGENADPA